MAGEVKCPKCGKPGRVARHKVRSKGRTYVYTAVKHAEGGKVRRCILGRVEEGRGGAPAQPPGSYEDALEVLSALYHRARERAAGGDPSGLEEFVVWVERRLSPAVARWYEEARALLGQR